MEFFQNLWAGKDATSFGNGFSIQGQLSDVNAWAGLKELDFMRDWTTCKIMGGGEAINWDKTNWKVLNMTKRCKFNLKWIEQ